MRLAKTPPTVIMLAGLQGAGKTTLAGKLAVWLKGQGHAPLLVACDLQRPNAVTQLQVVGDQAGVAGLRALPGQPTAVGVGDPVDAARQGVEHAKRLQHDVVIVDTAGRLGVDAELMQQAADIRDAVQPDEVLFVVDAMIGQDAVTTAQAFQEGVGFTGVVLTKLDGDARGGAALSVRHLTGVPIMFASTGEKLRDFDVFHPERMASRILGMGDVLTLIETAEKHFDVEQAEKAAAQAAERRRLRPRRLPRADAADQEDGLDHQPARDAPRHGSDEGGDRPGQGRGPRPDRRDHPLDDAAGAQGPQAAQRLAPDPHRQGLRHVGAGGQQPGRPLRATPRR